MQHRRGVRHQRVRRATHLSNLRHEALSRNERRAYDVVYGDQRCPQLCDAPLFQLAARPVSEIWKPVVGFEGRYEVSDLGRLRGLDRIDAGGRNWKGRLMRLTPDTSGYLGCTLRNGNARYVRACQAVARAFLGPQPPGFQVAHGPLGQQNDTALNLRWASPKDNAQDRVIFGTQLRGEAIVTSRLTETDVERARDLRRAGCTLTAIGMWIGTCHSNVANLVKHRTWAHV